MVVSVAEQQGGEVSPASIHALFESTYVKAPEAWRLARLVRTVGGPFLAHAVVEAAVRTSAP